MKLDPDLCRSLLFVPAGNERYLESALRGTADVIQIDLEDAIPHDAKDQAREDAKADIDRIHARKRVGVVRINHEPQIFTSDLDAVVRPGLAGLTIPKVSCAEDLRRVDQMVSAIEQEHNYPVGDVRLIAQIESAAGVLNVREIAQATPRLAAMGIGMEDLAAEVGCSVESDSLYFPSMQTLYAARESGLVPIGYLGSIAVYNELDTFRNWIRRAKSLGFDGGFCIHPNQVDILNEEFAPGIDEVIDAKALLKACELRAEEGSSPFSYRGRMVDKPILDRARQTIRRQMTLAARRDSPPHS